MAPSALAAYDRLPSLRMLYHWRNAAEKGETQAKPAAKRGRPAKFTNEELDLVAGYALFCDEHHQVCGIHEVQDFVQTAFSKRITPASVSVLLHKMGFATKSAKKAKGKATAAPSEGYHAIEPRSADMARCRETYKQWAASSTRNPSDLLPQSAAPQQLESALDGDKWVHYGTSRKRRVGEKRKSVE